MWLNQARSASVAKAWSTCAKVKSVRLSVSASVWLIGVITLDFNMLNKVFLHFISTLNALVGENAPALLVFLIDL